MIKKGRLVVLRQHPDFPNFVENFMLLLLLTPLPILYPSITVLGMGDMSLARNFDWMA